MRIKIFSVTLASLLLLQAGCADQSTVAGPPPNTSVGPSNASAGPSNAPAATGDQAADQKTSSGFPRAAASSDSNSSSSFFSVGTLSSIGAAAIAVAAALAAVL